MSEELDNYLGKLADDINPETIKLLLDDGYSISPKSGRIRRRLRVKEVRPVLSKRRVKKYSQRVLWVVIAIIFILCLVILLPQIESPKKGGGKPPTTK